MGRHMWPFLIIVSLIPKSLVELLQTTNSSEGRLFSTDYKLIASKFLNIAFRY